MLNPLLHEDDFLRDNGFQLVTAEDYVFFRLLPLIQYYNRRAIHLTNLGTGLQIFVFFLTALMSTATVLHFERWVPFIVALITSTNSTLEFENINTQLRNINQSLEALKNLRIWWQSLSMVERRMPSNKEILVSSTEATADAEISAWIKTLKDKKQSASEDEEAENEEK
eukprot:TRINITY_DN36870_c0_g1_i1.p1 TRINITY_DN36870_c0_g1~~TRINITY_DN36870_c0_g1_i1.p1  ORF type:complete len:169 (+),score=42.06 TRINITY_DN36870_c0_g1_i1:220-726(+)